MLYTPWHSADGSDGNMSPLIAACVAGRHGAAAPLLADKEYVESDIGFSQNVAEVLEVAVLQGFALTVQLLARHIISRRQPQDSDSASDELVLQPVPERARLQGRTPWGCYRR